MFGYVRPLAAELRVRELDEYKAVYCGLCRTMGKRHGFLARFTLNYDFTFLVMLLAYGKDPCQISLRRCPVHPLRRRKMCAQIPALEAAADESMILSYQKLRDDAVDNGFFRALPARLAAFFLTPAYRRAAEVRPEFDRMVTGCLEELHAMERERCPSLDRPADAFARILQAAAIGTGDGTRDRALGQLLYHVGRWIYLIDAWDDLEEDKRTGAYNPIRARYGDWKEECEQQLRTTLRHSRNLAASAYALAQSERWNEILSNILYLGMPAVEELVLTGRWRQNRKHIGE